MICFIGWRFVSLVSFVHIQIAFEVRIEPSFGHIKIRVASRILGHQLSFLFESSDFIFEIASFNWLASSKQCVNTAVVTLSLKMIALLVVLDAECSLLLLLGLLGCEDVVGLGWLVDAEGGWGECRGLLLVCGECISCYGLRRIQKACDRDT